MPELTFTVMLLEESLLKTEGIHKSRGLKERLSRVRFTGWRFARLQRHAASPRVLRRARRECKSRSIVLCRGGHPVSGEGCDRRDRRARGEVVLGGAQWEVVWLGVTASWRQSYSGCRCLGELCEGSDIKLRTWYFWGWFFWFFFSGFVKKRKEKILTSPCLPFPDHQGD